jgi:hypothetical protein
MGSFFTISFDAVLTLDSFLASFSISAGVQVTIRNFSGKVEIHAIVPTLPFSIHILNDNYT